VTFTFTKTDSGEWSVGCTIPDDIGDGASFLSGSTASATIDIGFDTNGAMETPAANVGVVLDLKNGASDFTIRWNFVDGTGNSLGDVTGYAAPSGTTFQYQDGYPAGTLRSITVDDMGVITATYSNGEMTPVFQVALADFPSYDGLSKMGNNLYAQSMASGQALPSTAGTGRLGTISPQSLEMSNVDLAEEFVKMITTQRAFQANSRVITTSDEILQELINIKR